MPAMTRFANALADVIARFKIAYRSAVPRERNAAAKNERRGRQVAGPADRLSARSSGRELTASLLLACKPSRMRAITMRIVTALAA